ncbi:hypothetical protein GCM10028784_09570 [Myceligenerans cantabricum]
MVAGLLSLAVVTGVMVGTPEARADEASIEAEEGVPAAFMIDMPLALSATVDGTTKVEVTAWPSPEVDKQLELDEEFTLHTVEASTSISGGQMAVHVDPTTIPADYISADGMVDFEVQVLNLDAGWTRSTATTSRVVEQATGPTWIDPLYTVEDLSALGAEVVSAPVADLVETAELPDECEDSETIVEDCEPEMPATATGPSGLAAGDCIYWASDGRRVADKLVMVRTGATFALKTDDRGSKAHMIYQDGREHNTTSGIGVSLNNSSWYAEGTKSTSDDWGMIFGKSQGYKSYRIQMKYGKYMHKYIVYPNCSPLGSYTKYGFKWRARFETGGVAAVNISRPKAFSNCAPVGTGDWFRSSSSGSAYEHGGGVIIKSAIEINLKSKSQYSSRKKYVYSVVGPKQICGNNRSPSKSRLQMLRWRS